MSILLSSRFSMWMAWGPELTFFCNAAYRRDTLGSKYPWALGRPASEVWAEIWDDIGPRIERVLETGQATWDAGLLLFLERSGYPEETYHTFSYSPLRDELGHVVGMLCVVSEDTDRVIGERRMATLRDLGSDPTVVRVEDQLLDFAARQLGRNVRDLPFTLTYLFDDDGAARLAAASGIDRDHPLASPTALPSGDQPPVRWPVERAAAGEPVLLDLDGDGLNLPAGDWPDPPRQALVMPLVQQGGAPYGFLVAALNRYRPLDEGYRGFVELVAGHLGGEIGSARSYRAQLQRADELAELDRAKTTFFSNISHEFRTPLTLISGPVADLLGRAEDVSERGRDELDLVHRNALRLTKLVNTLLDFSRIEAGRMHARFEALDVAAVTAELASVFRSAVDRAGLDLVVDCTPLDEPVFLDHDMWEKVMFNLLSNAVKFTFDGAITVRVRGDDDRAVITVADTGTGVPAAEMPRLFERFHRVEAARARSNEGSGIGLALVKELIGLHGGSITADSVEGTGTTFTIELPFGTAHLPADADLTATATADERAPSGSVDPYVQEALRWLPSDETPEEVEEVTPASMAGTSARVLIADDNADMRDYLARLLRTAGYDVDVVVDGRQALDGIRADPPDLVISDVMMPRLDGLALVAAVRADPRIAAVPVLLLSARAGQEASIEGLHAGADDYLVKPFAAADLLARVRANVELARLRNHHARWRTALVDSLQEAFFVCDEHGTVIEVNTGFTDVLGYGPDGLPYERDHPWWPDAATDAESHQQVADAFTALVDHAEGSHTLPLTHRDGHRVWVTFNFNHAEDPDTGRRVMVGTFRDVTAQHYTVQRHTALAELTQLLAQADTFDVALSTAANALRTLWRAHRVLTLTFDADASSGTVSDAPPEVVCVGEPAARVGWAELSPRTREAIETLRDGDFLIADVITDVPEFNAAGIAVPHPQGGVLVLWIELAHRQRLFAAEDQALLTVLTARLGQGLQRVHQLDQQRETALTLQHAMLGPVNLPGGFAVRYQPATRPLQVGGDWYDVVALGDQRVGLIVGDCVGHGLAAATVMGQLRSACRALLLQDPAPSAALSGLDLFAADLPGAACTTAFCAVLDTDTGELTYSSAGHPPPILVHGDRNIELLDDGRSLPLGLRPGRPRPDARVVLAPRTTMLLYTDGLVERRREPLDEGIARAAHLVRDGNTSTLDEVASAVLTQLAPDGGYQDDVALLLYRQPAPLQVDIPAHASELAGTRTALRGWLTRAQLDPEQSQDVLLAAGEALANAIEHGHRNSPAGTITLHASLLPDRIHLRVVDTGAWKTARPDLDTHRGRGLMLMRALMHDVTIASDSSGTTIDMTTRINP